MLGDRCLRPVVMNVRNHFVGVMVKLEAMANVMRGQCVRYPLRIASHCVEVGPIRVDHSAKAISVALGCKSWWPMWWPKN